MKKQKKIIKNNKAITLIALVVTIVVLLILAGTSIAMLSGENGIIKQAKNAKNNQENAEEQEQNTLDFYERYIQNSTGDTQNDKYVDINELSAGDYISNYPVEYANVTSMKGYDEEGNLPNSNFIGWRVLAIESDSNENKYVKLVSAGIPMRYYFPYNEGQGCEQYVKKLTENYLTTSFSFDSGHMKNTSGFNMGENTTLENIFKNDYTSKVQSLTKEDLDKLFNTELQKETDLSNTEYGDLLAIPCEDDESIFAYYWLATAESFLSIYFFNETGTLSSNDDVAYGVRPVISLVPEVKFKQSSTKINNTTTWEISLED